MEKLQLLRCLISLGKEGGASMFNDFMHAHMCVRVGVFVCARVCVSSSSDVHTRASFPKRKNTDHYHHSMNMCRQNQFNFFNAIDVS